MQIHPYAQTFPWIEGTAWEEFKNSISTHGLMHPIKTCRGVIIDGRNRNRACQELGIAATFIEVDPDLSEEQIRSFIDIENKHRRHMSAGQLAAHGAVLANAVRGGDRDISNPSAEGMEITVAQAAELTGSSVASIERAKFVQQNDPQVFEVLKAGELSTSEALEIARASMEQAQSGIAVGERIEAWRTQKNDEFRARKEDAIQTIKSREIIDHVCPACGHAHEVKIPSEYFHLQIKAAG